jgi:hypothetical protein
VPFAIPALHVETGLDAVPKEESALASSSSEEESAEPSEAAVASSSSIRPRWTAAGGGGGGRGRLASSSGPPACAPSFMSNNRFYRAWRGPILQINATRFGHLDCCDEGKASLYKLVRHK